MVVCPDVILPTTLKTALEFSGALSTNERLRERVGQQLENRVKEALGLTVTPNSVAGGSIKENFETVLSELNALRVEIVDYGDQNKYGSYDFLRDCSANYYCAKLCVSHMLTIFPPLYATLSFIKFKVDGSEGGLGGGGWQDQQPDGEDTQDSGTGTTLYQWLTNTAAGVPSASGPKPTLLPGGYRSARLGDSSGKDLLSPLANLVSDSGDGSAGPLRYLLLDVAIATQWSHCSTAPCLAVLRALYEKSSTTFKTQIAKHKDLGTVLEKPPVRFELLAPNMGEDDDALLTALFEDSPTKYSAILKTEAFNGYVTWLNENLDKLIKSLSSLSADSAKWTKEGFEQASISGPFGYGFSFGGKWKRIWSDERKNEIPTAINKLTQPMNKLQEEIKKITSHTSESSGHGHAGNWNQGISEPGSDGPRKPGSSGVGGVGPNPTSLKDALDFAAALSVNQGLKESVGQELEDRIMTKLKLHTELKSVSGDGSIKDNFNNVFDNLGTLRKSIVGNGDHGDYGSYHTLQSLRDYSCVDLCVKYILGILPRLYATLSYLYFQVEEYNDQLGGSGWEDQNCNSGTLSQWFKSNSGLPSALQSTTTLLPGGYSNNLSSNSGHELQSSLDSILRSYSADDGGSLHYLLLDLVIITPWSPCNTATCVAAVRAICDKISQTFKDRILQYPNLGSAFNRVSTHITIIAPDDEGLKDPAILTALFTGAPLKYTETLQTEGFGGYMVWLKGILNALLTSLTFLSRDSATWSQEGLKSAKNSGPFGYGFSFGTRWNSWNSNVKGQFSSALSKLTNDLTKLRSILENEFTTSQFSDHRSSSTVDPGSSEPGSDGPRQLVSGATPGSVAVSGVAISGVIPGAEDGGSGSQGVDGDYRPQGPRGDKGETGDQGDRGVKGDSLSSSSDLGDQATSSNSSSLSPPVTVFPAPSGASSPAGPVAGTLTTVVFGGGAAAVYFNVGGVCTILKGILGLH
ncbi:ribosome binding protein [Babesia caballi]|uniref:Ribosome binding protein n=1 Tax=Babesia caballi TaxID=5871 RepID=A0AAV4LXW5_BABCB|nr:ribosome binding protein [Babesia caballi]